MARTYWVRGPTSVAEGDTLDAHTARVLLQGNLESVYEEDRFDYVVLYQASQEGSGSWWGGPHPIPARRDRDGLFRSIRVTPLASSEGAKNTLRVYFTPRYYEPVSTVDESTDWDVESSDVEWQTAQTFRPPRYWDPFRHLSPDGDESGLVRWVWLTWQWRSSAGSPAPRFSGFRVEELVR